MKTFSHSVCRLSFGWITELLRCCCCCPFEASMFVAPPQPCPTHLPTPPHFLAGVDKENVQLSPSSALSSGGRTRHGSASQVQKQRSAGSFKRPSIKKIVWGSASHPSLLLLLLLPSPPPLHLLLLHPHTLPPSLPPPLPPSLPGLITALRFLLFSSPNSIFTAVVPGRSGFAFCTEEENQELFGVARGELWTFRWKGIRRLVEVAVEVFFLCVLGARCWYWRPATATEKDSGTWRGYWSFWPILLETVI